MGTFIVWYGVLNQHYVDLVIMYVDDIQFTSVQLNLDMKSLMESSSGT